MSSRYENEPRYDAPVNNPRWGKVFAIVLSIVLAVVLIGGALIFFLGHNLINLTNYVSDQDVQVVDAGQLPSDAVETVSSEDSIGKKVSDEELAKIHEEMEKNRSREAAELTSENGENKDDKTSDRKSGLIVDDDIFNFLLIGVDRRDKSWNGNSDSMMLVSINYTDERVSIISLMRDMYVNIPGVGYQKLNNAYARGGGPLLTQTISETFGVDLERYAAVDFENMIQIVDALDGVDLEWTEAEITVANGYIYDMCDTLGLNGDEYILPLASGTYHCNGVQAVAYARNRFVGNSDYARTERQRYVISQILAKVKSMNLAQITMFATKVMPLVTHNFSEKEIWTLVKRVTDVINYSFVQDRVPYDGMYDTIYVNSQDMLVPFWDETIAQLHETIYGSGTISSNSDNKAEDRTSSNNEFSFDFEKLILKGGAQEETPFVGDTAN